MLRVSSSVALTLLALCLFLTPAFAGDDEIWLSSARSEAERDDYKLIDTTELKKLLQAEEAPLIIDVRADYEFEAGHIPGAENLEFDLGDRMALPGDKKTAFQKMVGPDRKRQMVIYCRSFR